ncbi:VOC family protein [Saccharopolyspora sp. NPDC047091]|uniref:VOC family protein n=1 Tax=Saccharopolyspora sp. NPDC047091 TaxID=3155924 RepID=UPI0033E5B33B
MEITSYAPGTPCWVDLNTADPGTTAEFYAELFGWTVRDTGPASGGYLMLLLGGEPVAGIGPQFEPAPGPTFWTTYLSTDDVDASAAAFQRAGGQVHVAPMDVLDAGRIAVGSDPTGAAVALWQPRRTVGSARVDEPGAPCWHELATREPERATAFYRELFGWEVVPQQVAGADYRLLRLGGREIGGMIRIGADWPAEVPPHWQVYFAVPDADRALQRLTALGGTVRTGPVEIEPGRFAVVQDPAGGVFGIIALRA